MDLAFFEFIGKSVLFNKGYILLLPILLDFACYWRSLMLLRAFVICLRNIFRMQIAWSCFSPWMVWMNHIQLFIQTKVMREPLSSLNQAYFVLNQEENQRGIYNNLIFFFIFCWWAPSTSSMGKPPNRRNWNLVSQRKISWLWYIF